METSLIRSRALSGVHFFIWVICNPSIRTKDLCRLCMREPGFYSWYFFSHDEKKMSLCSHITLKKSFTIPPSSSILSSTFHSQVHRISHLTSIKPPSLQQVWVLKMLKINMLCFPTCSSLLFPDMCSWWGSRIAARSFSTGCLCQTSKGSCPSFTPPP